MEKRKTFHGRQVGKKRLLPIVFPLFLFLLIPLNGYGDDTPMPEVVQQNSTRITGVVKDAYGEPVIGANVKVVGTTQGTITDFEGKFSINVSGASAKIKISFIGYKDKEVTAKKGVSLNIVLEEDAQTLGEVQVVAYGVQKKVSITGAISSMKGDDLLKTPAGSLSNVLSGQITGISSVQYSGEPGADAADIYVRGVATWNNAKPLIQVDGVERDFSQIDPNEIESVTVLKDASATAVFGVRGANGVILITTKRGAEGKAKVSFSTSAGVNVRTKDLEFANSYQYASYYNMMKVNDGGVATFSDEQLETFRNHSNPLMYPDINWIDYCMNKAAFQSQHNVNISGGTSNMKYFVSAGLFTQGGMFKQFNATDDFNFDYKRYNYRANLDFDVTKTTLLSVNIGGRIETKRTPESGEDQNQLFRKLYWAVPFAGAGIVNGERVVSNSEVLPFTGVDGLSSYYGKGFQTKTTNVLNVDLALNQKLDFITKGLSVKLKGAYNSEYANTKKASSSKAYYTPVANADGSISLRKYGTDSQLSYGEPDNGFSKARNWYMELALNYARKFGDHNVTALLLYNQSKKYYPSEYSDIPTGYVGLVGRVTYDWKTRYMAEFNAGYNGSENFRPGNRYGFFPAGSLGWVVSEESFFQPIKSVVNYLKLRASVGMVGNDVSQRFLYLPDSYQYGDGGYYFGQNVGCDNAVRGNVLAIGQLALNGVLIVLELVAHGRSVLLDVVLQLVERARAIAVLVGLSTGKEDLEHHAVNALGRLPTRITHRHAIRLLFFFTPQQAFLGLGHGRLLQLDHTVVGELHERGDICLIGHLVPAHEGRKHCGMVGRRHIAEIFVLEKRLWLAAAQLEHNDCAGKGHRRENT